MSKETREAYPVTIIRDRYGGTYSGAKWTAWNFYENEIPQGASSNDVACAIFWENNVRTVGFGNNPEEALKDLHLKLFK